MRTVKNSILILAMAAVVAAVAAESIPQNDAVMNLEMPKFSLGLEVNSAHVSKGKVGNDEPVADIILCAKWYGAFAKIKAEYDLTDFNSPDNGGKYINNRQYRTEQVDYSLGYEYKFDQLAVPITISAQYKYKQYPRRRSKVGNSLHHYREEELNFVAKADGLFKELLPFKLGVGVEVDYDLENYCWFGNIFATGSRKLTDRLTLSVKTTAYWRDSQSNLKAYDRESVTVNAIEIKPSLKYAFTKDISATIYGAGAWSCDSDTRNSWKKSATNNAQNFWCGASIDWKF